MRLQWLWAGSLLPALFVVGCKQEQRTERTEPAEKAAVSSKAQTTCPVMDGEIDKSIYADHAGKRVYFCCPMCIAEFKKTPEKYIKEFKAEGVVLEDAPARELWTCSMHPQVKQSKPGKCPTCMMDLVPAPSGGADEERSQEGRLSNAQSASLECAILRTRL